MDELLSRYTEKQQKIIAEYWDTIRQTRDTGKVSERIIEREVGFWAKYEPGVVIEALEIHIDKYPLIREQYTRGIMRNLAKRRAQEPGGGVSSAPARPRAGKNRFVNFEQRDIDYEVMEKLEALQLSGLLTEEKRNELRNDPRYAKYL
ncbi:MAG: hypothetical protein FWF44_05445 [Defluviitaleaceae bacterium]|nr:hypothetical protein [Defluviitaleaceae bacterium]